MKKQLRIWRVVPVSKTNAQAPYYFVETTEYRREVAEELAYKEARKRCTLSRFEDWDFRVEKEPIRKDEFGRYMWYHQ